MIDRIRERIHTAISRIENRFVPYLLPPTLMEDDKRFFMMDERKLIVDQNLYPTIPAYYPVSMVSLNTSHVHTYRDGMMVIFPSHCTIPMPNGFLPHSELNVPLMLIGTIDPTQAGIESEAPISLIEAALNAQQEEPLILLRNLFYRRPELELISVEQIQLLYTNVIGRPSRSGPTKTTLDPSLVGISQTTNLEYVPAFRWNPVLQHGENMLNFALMGENGLHVWPLDASLGGENFTQFIAWLSRLDLRTNRSGWFADPEDEMRALTMLGRL